MSDAARSAAAQEFDIANQTEEQAKTAATGSFISSAFKGHYGDCVDRGGASYRRPEPRSASRYCGDIGGCHAQH
jgi:hypothetical protein